MSSLTKEETADLIKYAQLGRLYKHLSDLFDNEDDINNLNYKLIEDMMVHISEVQQQFKYAEEKWIKYREDNEWEWE